jgi:LacI family transcriptional regulator
MRDLARRVGVSSSTVSKALRNDPTISRARCREVQEWARKLGYRPNPMVATLMAQLHHNRRRSDPCQLAWIDLWPAQTRRDSVLNRMLAGAVARAQELGFGLEVYSASPHPLNPDRLRRLLSSKSQWGFIIPPVPEDAARFPLDVSGLSGVTLGTSLREPALNRVSPNHFQELVLAFENIRRRGARRIGLALTQESHRRVERKWLGAYLACTQPLPSDEQLPPCLMTEATPKLLREWCARHRPDAILTPEHPVISWVKTFAKKSQPALGSWILGEGAGHAPGVINPFEHMGAVAVELVVGQIHRNERGCPAIPHTVEVDAYWQDSSAAEPPTTAGVAHSNS